MDIRSGLSHASVRTLCALFVAVTIAACGADPSGPEGEPLTLPEPSYARGGIPGPPVDVVIRHRIGPPPGARVRIPAQAGPPAFLSSMVAVGAGFEFSCALRSDGQAFCWGENLDGQLGDGRMVASAAPVAVQGQVPFVQLFVGDLHACGIDAGGFAYCWGDNSSGQLGAGIPEGTDSPVPVLVEAPHQFSGMSLGVRSSCGMGLDGLAYCWGLNSRGWLGVGSPEASTTVPMPVVNSGTVGLVDVNTSGLALTCGLAVGGELFCWGLDAGNFGNGTADNGDALTPTAAASGLRFTSVHVSTLMACGLDFTGAAYCWGRRNDLGEMGIGSTADPVLIPTPVVGGLTFASLDEDDTNRSFKSTCGVTPGGQGWCWGANGFGQLGGQSSETCLQVGPPFSPDCSTSPIPVSGGIQFAQIKVGGDHACGLAIDGAVYCWGRNHIGQLGDGTLTNHPTPVAVRLN